MPLVAISLGMPWNAIKKFASVPPPKPCRGLTEEDAQKEVRVRVTARGRSNNQMNKTERHFHEIEDGATTK